MANPQQQPAGHASVVGVCEVTDCTYNEDRECHAGRIHVRIGENGAVCATYTPEKPKARP